MCSSLLRFSWNSCSVAGDLLHFCLCMYALEMYYSCLPSLACFLTMFPLSQTTQLPHSSVTSALSPSLLHFPPRCSYPVYNTVMALVLLLSLCCCQELAPEAGCALPFAGAVAIFCKMVQLSSVCILLLILSFVFLVLQSRLPLQRLTV